MPLDLDDITDATHDDRRVNFYKQMCRDDAPMEERVYLDNSAWKQATAEMLDEIHAMLRHLVLGQTPVP